VRPAKAIGTSSGRKATGRVIDGIGPDGIAARVIDVARGRQAANRLLPLRFAMLIGVAAFVLFHVAGGR